MTFPALPTPLLAAAGVLALAAAAPAPTAAQDAVPLARGDLVRMLEGGTYTLDEVARMIRPGRASPSASPGTTSAASGSSGPRKRWWTPSSPAGSAVRPPAVP